MVQFRIIVLHFLLLLAQPAVGGAVLSENHEPEWKPAGPIEQTAPLPSTQLTVSPFDGLEGETRKEDTESSPGCATMRGDGGHGTIGRSTGEARRGVCLRSSSPHLTYDATAPPSLV